MTKKLSKGEFNHSISMTDITNNLSRDMNLFMVRLLKEMRFPKDRIIPLILKLNISDDIPSNEIRQIRIFLKTLRQIQDSHFVRFSLPLIWAAEADGTDIFYTYTNDEIKHHDAIISIRVFDRHTLLLNATVSDRTYCQDVIHSLSKKLIHEIISLTNNGESRSDAVANIVVSCDKAFKNDNFQLLYIPSIEGFSFYSIPVFGMSADDAVRRVLAAEKSLVLPEHHRRLFKCEDTDYSTSLSLLLNLIREEEEDGYRYRTAKTTYALAELLYGYYVKITRGDDLSDIPNMHVLLFDVEVAVQAHELSHSKTIE